YAHWYTVIAATAMVWGAVYMLWMYQRVMMGDVTKPENKSLTDLSLREKFVLVPLVLLMIVMGVYPVMFTNKSQPSLDTIVRHGTWGATATSKPAGD
ncbi:MAG TPA: Fe-S-binding domain-containing protein, partial [Blastocatellia bacterium]|nr:Fe-S-binding domain-containing protein [Blastocatellia bacterium]